MDSCRLDSRLPGRDHDAPIEASHEARPPVGVHVRHPVARQLSRLVHPPGDEAAALVEGGGVARPPAVQVPARPAQLVLLVSDPRQPVEAAVSEVCISRLLLVLFFYRVVLIGGVWSTGKESLITVDFLVKSGMLHGTQLILLYVLNQPISAEKYIRIHDE